MKKINPKISVVMPVYNSEEFLNESIESILNQTFKDFEFIIINDGSIDNSLNIIRDYMKKDKRIVLINNPVNIGLNRSLNKGIGISRGKYIARMDADDISLPRRLEIQYNYLEKHPQIFLLGCSAIVIDKNGKRIGYLPKYQIFPFIMRLRLKKSNSLIHPTIMFRNLGFVHYVEAERDSKSEDEWLIYKKLVKDGKRIVNIPLFLLKYRINPKGMSAKSGLFDNSKWKKYIKQN